jgi:hypothetical protein
MYNDCTEYIILRVSYIYIFIYLVLFLVTKTAIQGIHTTTNIMKVLRFYGIFPHQLLIIRCLFLLPSSAPKSNQRGDVSSSVVKAKAAIVDAIIAAAANEHNGSMHLAPKFLRLAFHDCVGGCNGCVDLTNPDDNGLDIAINVLEPIVQQFSLTELLITRGDFWALAALTGAELAQSMDAPPGHALRIGFDLQYYGRVVCERDDNNSMTSRRLEYMY